MAHSIYIHLPFCRTRCPYCDFFSSVVDPVPFHRYREAALREWEWRTERGSVDDVVSIYIGGGTPSLWPAEELLGLLEPLPRGLETEITVEVNPGDADPCWFESLARFGVNRFSIGAQALDDQRLKWLGRRHSVEDVQRAFEWAARSGAKSISGDLIYGSPGMTASSLAKELAHFRGAGLGHVSAYELTLAPGTPFRRQLERNGEKLPDDDLLAELWHATGESLGRLGFSRYEVSSYARAGHQCRHNKHYWRSGFYLGLGAGAHGYIETEDGRVVRYANGQDVDRYLSFFESFQSIDAWCGVPGGAFEELSPLSRARERVMLGVRTTEGVLGFTELLGQLPDEIQRKWMREVDYCERIGLVERLGDGFVPTLLGLLNADSVAERFF